jgi:3-methylfumaryl-CoA hydratase
MTATASTAAADIDIDHLRQWIDRTETQGDIITPRVVDSLRATLEDVGEPNGPLPSLHWCVAPQIEPMSKLGEDGHAARGGFLPPVPLPNRMWASGELVIHSALKRGDHVWRESRVADVALKTGRTGLLCFVTVVHDYVVDGVTAIAERQHIVYRERTATSVAPAAASRPATWSREIAVSDALLFRYSALLFNAHRIHYDRDYCRAEGYGGLLVHGPLQASYLLHYATEIRGSVPARFDFRGVAPLIDDQGMILNAVEREGGLELWVSDRTGRMTMTASAGW